jgi:hypothetical protein
VFYEPAKDEMQTLPLADELFLIGHDEYSGKTIVGGEVLDTGLAGAVLGELLVAGRITCTDGKVVGRDPRPFGDSVTDAAVAEIRRKGDGYSTRAWIEYLRQEVREMIAGRLVRAELIQREQGRSMFRSVIRYPATDRVRAAAPRVRLRYVLERPRLIDLQSALLATLVRLCALESVLVLDLHPTSGVDVLTAATGLLPAEAQSLVASVDTAIAAVTLTIRR